MSLLECVQACAHYCKQNFRPFFVDEHIIGQIRVDTFTALSEFEHVFDFTGEEVRFRQGVQGFLKRTAEMNKVTRELFNRGLINGWRNEQYPVSTSFGAPVLFNIERAAVPFFGVRGYGVHVNGLVATSKGLKMWIGRRSFSKPTGPGLLDQIVAGGLPSGMLLMDNLIKECQEEAGIGVDLARQASPVGTISYVTEREEGLRHDILFNYDLFLPEEFSPVNEDGEVAEFMLWPIPEVVEKVGRNNVFKFNSALVIIDFLVRHSFVDPQSPGYTKIVSGLHRDA